MATARKPNDRSNSGLRAFWSAVGGGVAVLVIGGIITWGVTVVAQLSSINTSIANLNDAVKSVSGRLEKSDDRLIEVEKGLVRTEGAVSRQAATVDIRIQFGSFSKGTKVSDNPLTYDWKIKGDPIKREMLVSMAAEATEAVGPVSFAAQLANEGTVCRMVVSGDTSKMVAALDEGIPGKLTITTRSQ